MTIRYYNNYHEQLRQVLISLLQRNFNCMQFVSNGNLNLSNFECMLFTFYDVSHELTCIPSTVYICVFTENVRICALNENNNNNNNNKLTSMYTNIYEK